MLEQKHIDIICRALGITQAQIENIKVNHGGLSNFTYVVSISDGNKYLYRIPGPRTEVLCNRYAEYETHKMLAPFKFTQEIKYFDPETGIMLCYYHPIARTADIASKEDCRESARMIRMFHNLPITLTETLSNFDRIERNIKLYGECGGVFCDEYHTFMRGKYPILRAEYEKLPKKIVPSTGDFTPGNILFVEGGDTVMIDLEYTANADPYTDLSIFAHDQNMSDAGALEFLEMYLERKPIKTEEFKLMAECSFTGIRWYTWAMCKIILGGDHEKYDAFAAFSLQYAIDHFDVAMEYLK